MDTTITISKQGEIFKITAHKGFEHIDIYKDREYVEQLIEYLQYTLNDEHKKVDYMNDGIDYNNI